jgi:hypothetical protein
MTDNIGIKIDGNTKLADKLEGLVLNILNTSAGDSVKEKALDILEKAFPQAGNNSISNVHIEMHPPQPSRVVDTCPYEDCEVDYEDNYEDGEQ